MADVHASYLTDTQIEAGMAAVRRNAPAPRFQVGDRVAIGKVRTKLADYKGRHATVKGVSPAWREVDEASGRPKRRGYLETSLTGTCPMRVSPDGLRIEIDFPAGPFGPARTMHLVFAEWLVSLAVDGMPYGLLTAERDLQPLGTHPAAGPTEEAL